MNTRIARAACCGTADGGQKSSERGLALSEGPDPLSRQSDPVTSRWEHGNPIPGSRTRAYRPNRRWFVGARYDWSDRALDADVRDKGTSAVLTFWTSEFTQVGGRYRRTRYADGAAANELLFQTLFTIGAHGAHAF